jgi:hypothetical protein
MSDEAKGNELLAAPCSPCPFCHGKGSDGGHECQWCNGLSAMFSDVVFRGHAAYDGFATVIEGCCPVTLSIKHEGETLIFEKAVEKHPPFWFIKENGKQVYRLRPPEL